MTADVLPSPSPRAKMRVLPTRAPQPKPVERFLAQRTQWLRGGREPAIVVTNEAGELLYTVHRAIHTDPYR